MTKKTSRSQDIKLKLNKLSLYFLSPNHQINTMTNSPTPTLKYLLCADYGDFTIPSIMNDSLYYSLGFETKADIHIRPGGPVTLQNGSIMKGFKWRYTISVDMWAYSFGNNKTHFSPAKPSFMGVLRVKVGSDHDLGTNLAINGILGVPYGWGTINDKPCFLEDGVLNWTKTRDEHKAKGKRQNFGVDTTTTMDGDAWQMKTPNKFGHTLRSGRVLEQSTEDTQDFAMSQSKISIDHANSVKSMITVAAQHAQNIIEKAGSAYKCLTNLPHERCIAIANKEINKHLKKQRPVTLDKTVSMNYPKKPLYTPPTRESVGDSSDLETKVKEQDYEIKSLLKSILQKDEYIRLLKGNAEMQQKILQGQSELIQLYTLKND
jgi:hypothetical protein